MDRRGFLKGLVGVVAAPAIIRVIDLMPVKLIKPGFTMMKPGVYFHAWKPIDHLLFLDELPEIYGIPRKFLFGEGLNERQGIKNSKAELDRQLWC